MSAENGPIEIRIADYLSGATQAGVPDAVLVRARCHLLDALAAILSGCFLPAGRFGYAFAQASGTRAEATLLGTADQASLEYAAFANAMAAHADETDDSHARGRFHPGCAIVPAALAVAEREKAGADEILKAIALGFDLGARATMALGFDSPGTTVFSTHSFGALFGAAAASGALMKLGPAEAQALLSFTVQQASGLSYWNRDPDHIEKSFDFGAKAARNGVFAALLASAGMTAPNRPLTGGNGYLAAYAENPDPDVLCEALGERFEIEAASIKKWPVGSPIQSVLDGIETLFGGRRVDPGSVAAIEVQLPANRIHVVDDRPMPSICCQHLVALALLDGRVGFANSHDEARMRDPDILALREKITLVANEDLSHALPERQSIVSIRMNDGETRRQHTVAVRGTPDDPMPADEVAAKAADILAPILADGGRALTDLCLSRDFEVGQLVDACRIDPWLRSRIIGRLKPVVKKEDGMNAQDIVGATQLIAEFAVATHYDDIAPEALRIARHCIVDGTAVMLAGATEPGARIVREYVAGAEGGAQARTLGAGSMRAPTHLAALANGVAGHALDWDDTAMSLEKDRSVLIHPTMQPLCAGYALADHLGSSGRDFLAAFVLGFEVQVKLAESIHPDHFTGGRGFHSSGTLGVFGSTICAARLMGLDQEQTRNAIAIAATMAAGVGANHGTMSKPLNMGRAAETGVTAARLAGLGFDGPGNALEAGRGFFEAFGGGYDPERLVGRLGDPWALITPGTSIKPYPSGVVGHPGMDAMLRLVTDHDIAPADIESIEVRTGPNVIEPGPLRIPHAHTALEAKFCVPFLMAAIALRRKAGLEEFSDDFVESEACQALQRRVTAEIDPAIAALGKDKVVFDITVTTGDGRSFTGRSAEHYRGGPQNPLGWDELCAKFHDCAKPTVAEPDRDRFLELAARVEELPQLRELLDTVAA